MRCADKFIEVSDIGEKWNDVNVTIFMFMSFFEV